MANKSKIKHNNTKPGLCRKGGSWTADKAGKLTKNNQVVKKETKKTDNENGGK